MPRYRKVKKLDPVVAAYLAGLVDGEGTVTLTRQHRNEKRRVVVCISHNELEILELAKARGEFGAHTVTHPQLRDLDWNQVVREIGESRGIIEDKIGEKAESFSYPYAFPAGNECLKERLKDSLV